MRRDREEGDENEALPPRVRPAAEFVKNTNNVQKLLLSRYGARFTAGQQARIGVGLGDINHTRTHTHQENL